MSEREVPIPKAWIDRLRHDLAEGNTRSALGHARSIVDVADAWERRHPLDQAGAAAAPTEADRAALDAIAQVWALGDPVDLERTVATHIDALLALAERGRG